MRYPTPESALPRGSAFAACLLSFCLLTSGCSDGDSRLPASGEGATDVDNSVDSADDTVTAAISAGLRINEIVASNQLGLADEDGDLSDWIELFNPGNMELDLTGWHLSDDQENLTKWTFPPQVLAAESYLVVFASDKDRATAGAQLHTNFRLSAGGEFLALSSPAGTVVVDEFSPAFPALLEDEAYGVRSDGTVGSLSAPTPGAANTP